MIRDYTGRDWIVIFIYAVTFTFCFFLMFLGILRIFEINDYFGNEQYLLVKEYCEPEGFFGWGYSCNNSQYAKDMGHIIPRYEKPYWNLSYGRKP